jgi:hypothetical protein
MYRKPVNFLGFYVTIEFKDGLMLGYGLLLLLYCCDYYVVLG